MANEHGGPAGPPGSGGKKRPMPTIDLARSEIESAPDEPPHADAQAAAAEAKAAADEPATVSSAPSPEPDEPPVSTEQAQAADEPEASEEPQEQEEEADEPAQPRGTVYETTPEPDLSRWIPDAAPSAVPWSSLGAGALGAMVMLIGLWLFGVLSGDGARVVENRVLRLEGQLRDLARAQQGQPAVDPGRLEELSARVARIEAAPPPPPAPAPAQPRDDSAIEGRLGAAEEVLKALDQNVVDLHRRSDEINASLRDLRQRAEAGSTALADLTRRTTQQGTADRGEVDALGRRVAAAESALQALQADLARLAAGAPDRAVRLAVVASGLRAAVERAAPFAAELAAVKALGADATLLASLEAFAPSGVPSATALGREFAAVSSGLLPAAGATAGQGGGFLERLQANAEKLVRVRPIDEAPPDDDVRAIVTRAQARAAQGDLAATLAEVAKLPPALRAPVEPWIAKVEARAAAIDASRRLASDALAAVAR